MLAALAGLSQQQQQLGRSLPLPLAAAWQHLLLASGQRQAEQRLALTVDVALRTLAAMAVADYLRGPAYPEVDQALADLGEADRSAWWPLLAALATIAPPEPSHILASVGPWLRKPQGERPPGLELLRQCLVATSHPIEASAADFTRITRIGHSVGLVAGLLESLAWLAQWRLVQVASLTTVRRGGFRGELQLLVGAQVEPVRHAATWTAHLLANTVYLASPAGDALLEVAPLLVLVGVGRRQTPHCQLWSGVRAPDLVLLGEIPGERQSTVATHAAPTDGRPWLTGALQPLLHRDPQLAADLPPPPPLEPLAQAPPRPMADLSDRAFAPPEPAPTTPGWSRRLGLGLQVAVLLALVVAAAVGLAPKPRPQPVAEPQVQPIANAVAVAAPASPSAAGPVERAATATAAQPAVATAEAPTPVALAVAAEVPPSAPPQVTQAPTPPAEEAAPP
ncbi:MAG: hypothetical protein HY902_02525, partial [Deltaproteobacteria bacterium]|nr:hypothetical protein [Deltaproteobacteria bacterium]